MTALHSVVQQLKTLLKNAPDLAAASSTGAYATQLAYVWHLPADVSTQTLALAFEAEGAPIDAADAAETITMRCWYLASTLEEAMLFRDALVAKLNRQQHALRTQGVLGANIVELVGRTIVGVPPDTGRPQAYATFRIVA